MKVSESTYLFLILYVDDILFVTNLLVQTNEFQFCHFDMKYLGEASYVLCIKILRNRSSGTLRLS